MPRRRLDRPAAELLADLERELKRLGQPADGGLREKVKRLVEVYAHVRDLGVRTVRDHGLDSSSAQERILLYFKEYVGEVIDGPELEVVSGISEYARRIREIRVERGYQVATGNSIDPDAGIDLGPDQYMLVSIHPDDGLARRWHIANRIRREVEGSKSRVLQFLKENVEQVVTTEELAYVAKAREFGRRTRELRTEEGYSISTRFTGRPDLAVGQYVLESLERVAAQHDRNIPDKVQREVYARDRNQCRECGWTREQWSRDRPRILELHHVEHHAEGGQNSASNLLVLCSRCHDEVHAGKRTLTSMDE